MDCMSTKFGINISSCFPFRAQTVKGKVKEVYSSLCYKHRTVMGTHVPYIGSHSVTCYPEEVTFPPLPQPIRTGTRFIDHRGMRGWVDLVGLVLCRRRPGGVINWWCERVLLGCEELLWERLLGCRLYSKEALTKQSPPNQDTNNVTTAQDGQPTDAGTAPTE